MVWFMWVLGFRALGSGFGVCIRLCQVHKGVYYHYAVCVVYGLCTSFC